MFGWLKRMVDWFRKILKKNKNNCRTKAMLRMENGKSSSRDNSHADIMLPDAWDRMTVPQLIMHIDALNIESKRKTKVISHLQRNFSSEPVARANMFFV